jgi:hypothetical protein
MLYNSHAEDDTDVDEWFDECRQLANDGDANATTLMEVKALLDAHHCPQFAGSLAFADSQQDDEYYHYDEKRATTLQALLAFIDTRKDPIPEMEMTWIEFWASGGGKRIWKAFTSTFAAKARQQYKNASEFLQQALGLSSMAVTCSACALCNLDIHDEVTANVGAILEPCEHLVHKCCVAQYNLIGKRCPAAGCEAMITGHKVLSTVETVRARTMCVACAGAVVVVCALWLRCLLLHCC